MVYTIRNVFYRDVETSLVILSWLYLFLSVLRNFFCFLRGIHFLISLLLFRGREEVGAFEYVDVGSAPAFGVGSDNNSVVCILHVRHIFYECRVQKSSLFMTHCISTFGPFLSPPVILVKEPASSSGVTFYVSSFPSSLLLKDKKNRKITKH